jgi:hypothetical protein
MMASGSSRECFPYITKRSSRINIAILYISPNREHNRQIHGMFRISFSFGVLREKVHKSLLPPSEVVIFPPSHCRRLLSPMYKHHKDKKAGRRQETCSPSLVHSQRQQDKKEIRSQPEKRNGVGRMGVRLEESVV